MPAMMAGISITARKTAICDSNPMFFVISQLEPTAKVATLTEP